MHVLVRGECECLTKLNAEMKDYKGGRVELLYLKFPSFTRPATSREKSHPLSPIIERGKGISKLSCFLMQSEQINDGESCDEG